MCSGGIVKFSLYFLYVSNKSVLIELIVHFMDADFYFTFCIPLFLNVIALLEHLVYFLHDFVVNRIFLSNYLFRNFSWFSL